MNVVSPMNQKWIWLEEKQHKFEYHLAETMTCEYSFALFSVPLHFLQFEFFYVPHVDETTTEETKAHVDPQKSAGSQTLVPLKFQIILNES